MPGMENLAPERTETSSGFLGSPNRLPIFRSTVASARRTSSIRPGGKVRPLALYALHTAVVIVNPGGTGRPTRLISASPAPLPPSRSRIVALPSSNNQMRFRAARAPAGRPAADLRAAARRAAGLRDVWVAMRLHLTIQERR